MQTFISTLKGAVLHMREIVIVRVYFLHPRYFLISCAPVEIVPFDTLNAFNSGSIQAKTVGNGSENVFR